MTAEFIARLCRLSADLPSSYATLMSNETVRCELHGEQPISFVCKHIAHGLFDGSTPGFVIAPEDDHPLPLAWCDVCDSMVESLGDGWSEAASERADFKLLCAGCYAEAKGLAVVAGRFLNLRNHLG